MTITKIKIAATLAGAIVLTGAGAMPLVTRAAGLFATPIAQSAITTLVETQTPPASQPAFGAEVNEKTKVEILGLTTYPPGDDTWFAANGQPIDIPRESFAGSAHNIHAMPAPDMAMAIRVQKPDTSVVRMHIGGATTLANMQMNDNGETILLCAFSLENSPKSLAFRVGIAEGAWKTVAASENPSEQSAFDAPNIGQVTFQPLEADNDGCKVIAEHPMIDEPNHIIVVDQAGKEYETENINQQTDGQNTTTTCTFKCPPDKVKQVLFQTRQFTKFVEATDVSLEKSHMTQPVLKVVDAKEGK
jgi:hypothetical protein